MSKRIKYSLENENMMYICRSSCWTTASSFRQPPSTRSTVSARYIRPSHLRCCWTNDMELVPKQVAWAGHANWLFSSYTEDVSFWSVLGTLSALEALFAMMCYINRHLHFTWCRDSPLLGWGLFLSNERSQLEMTKNDRCYAYGRPCAYVTKLYAYGRPYADTQRLCIRPA